jgi:hypothetical protein
MVWMKYSSAILLIPASVLFLDRKMVKKALITLLVFALMMIPLMMYHQYYYSSPFSTGYSNETVTQPYSIPWLDKDSFNSLFFHSVRFFHESSFSIPFVLFSFICLLIFFNREKKFSWVILLTLLVCLLFFGLIKAIDGISVNYLSIPSSYHRYLMPVYALLVIPAAVFLSSLKNKMYKVIMLVLLALNISVALFAPNFSMSDRIDMAKRFGSDSEQLLNVTDNDSVIMSWQMYRMTYGKRTTYFFGEVNDTKRLEDVKMLLKDKYDLYLVMDFNPSNDTEEIFMKKINTEEVAVLNKTGAKVLKIGALKS